MILPLPRITSYSGAKPCATSTPIFDLGRSLMCPTDAFTVNPAPRYFLIVFALAGDSTITSARSFPALGAALGPVLGAALGAAWGAALGDAFSLALAGI